MASWRRHQNWADSKDGMKVCFFYRSGAFFRRRLVRYFSFISRKNEISRISILKDLSISKGTPLVWHCGYDRLKVRYLLHPTYCTLSPAGPSTGPSLLSHTAARTAWDMLSDEQTTRHITTFSGELDAILGGGIHCNEITEVGKWFLSNSLILPIPFFK